MKMLPQEVMSLSDQLFTDQQPMLSVWQTLSEYFYPTCGGFTQDKTKYNYQIYDHLFNSAPVRARRDLANAIGSMLRDGKWFKMDTIDPVDDEGERWLHNASEHQFRLMNFGDTGFNRAMRDGDNFFVTFGQFVCSVEMNRNMSGLLYRTWHLRDCAWFDNEAGQVGGVTRKWMCSLRDMMKTFGANAGEEVLDQVRDQPFDEREVRHIVIPSEMYGDEELIRFPYVSLYIDASTQMILEEMGRHDMYYIVPRWHTVPNSPYALSPATADALPDARMAQGMASTLIEAAERFTRPNYLMKDKAIRSDVNLQPDGVTVVDASTDYRMGQPLMPLSHQQHGYPIGDKQFEMCKQDIADAFFLGSLRMPDKNMTATEFREWVKDFRRKNLPLFQPIESEISSKLCEVTFELLMRHNLFGSPRDIPESLQGRDVVFKFESPLRQADGDEIIVDTQRALELVAQTAQVQVMNEQSPAVDNFDFDYSLRTALESVGLDPGILKDPEFVDQQRQVRQEAMREAREKSEALAQTAAENGKEPETMQ